VAATRGYRPEIDMAHIFTWNPLFTHAMEAEA
jgi:hypothetical protein